MSKVYADVVATPEPTDDLTLGGSGDNVIVTAGATLKTNTVKDSGGNTLFTSDGSGNLSSLNSAIGPSNMILLTTQTVTNQASVSFTSSIDNTYKLYIFKFYDVNPVTDAVNLTFQANVVGASGYNETITSTLFVTNHHEDDDPAEMGYDASLDQALGTAFQPVITTMGNAADESGVGELYLFNPSNTTYIKHFYATSMVQRSGSEGAYGSYVGGFFDVTGAIDDIQFKMSSGNFDGTIKMYGVG